MSKLLATLALFVAGCATFATASTHRLPDGAYELVCTTSLPRCLDHADDVCQGAGYDVVRAKDQRDYRGPGGIGEAETRTSSAVVRCGSRGGAPLLGGSKPTPAESAPPPTPPAPSPAPRPAAVCVPGATQECVGAGACRGGQSCLPDGSGYSACVCAPPAEAPPAAGTGPR
jgi:hypothetical protein